MAFQCSSLRNDSGVNTCSKLVLHEGGALKRMPSLKCGGQGGTGWLGVFLSFARHKTQLSCRIDAPNLRPWDTASNHVLRWRVSNNTFPVCFRSYLTAWSRLRDYLVQIWDSDKTPGGLEFPHGPTTARATVKVRQSFAHGITFVPGCSCACQLVRKQPSSQGVVMKVAFPSAGAVFRALFCR